MRITRFMLLAKTCSAISVLTCLSVFMWKCVDPIQDFIVPKGCSTVWRRRRILSGFRCIGDAQRLVTASGSQREIRRSLPVVHLLFSAHGGGAVLQVRSRGVAVCELV